MKRKQSQMKKATQKKKAMQKKKATQMKRLQRQHQLDLEKDLESFLNEGRSHLADVDEVYKLFKNSSELVTDTMKMLETYTRWKMLLRENMRKTYEIWGNDNDDEDFENMFELMQDEDDDDVHVEPPNYDRAKWRNLSDRHITLMHMELYMKSLIVQMEKSHYAIPRIRVLMYRDLTDYCERTRLFLRVHARERREWRNEKSDTTSSLGCKYDLLKQLLTRVDEVLSSRNLAVLA